jgi:hypothetical protein
MLTSCHKREIYFYRLVQSAASTYRLSAELKLFRIQLETICSEKSVKTWFYTLCFFYLKINKYYYHCLSFKHKQLRHRIGQCAQYEIFTVAWSAPNQSELVNL